MQKSVKISVNADNITEILGYYHHELSQHTNDLNTLKQHVHNLLTRSQPGPSGDLQIFLDTSNTRLESFAATIKSLTQQMVLLESSYKRDIESSTNKMQSYINDCISKINLRIDEIIDNQLNRKDNENIDNNEKEMLFAVKAPSKSKSSLKKAKKRKQFLYGQKERSNCQSVVSQASNNQQNENASSSASSPQQNINQNQNHQQNQQQQINEQKFMNEISILKNSLNDYRKSTSNEKEELKEILLKTNREMIDEFNNVYSKIDDCVTKNELDSILIERKPTCLSPFQTPKLQTPRRTLHVTLINGDSLSGRRQQQQQGQTKNSSYAAMKGKSRVFRQTQ